MNLNPAFDFALALSLSSLPRQIRNINHDYDLPTSPANGSASDPMSPSFSPEDGGDFADSNPLASFQTYTLVLTVLQYVVPLLVITFAYVRMGTREERNGFGAMEVRRDMYM